MSPLRELAYARSTKIEMFRPLVSFGEPEPFAWSDSRSACGSLTRTTSESSSRAAWIEWQLVFQGPQTHCTFRLSELHAKVLSSRASSPRFGFRRGPPVPCRLGDELALASTDSVEVLRRVLV